MDPIISKFLSSNNLYYGLIAAAVVVLLYYIFKKNTNSSMSIVDRFKPQSSGTPFLDVYTIDFTNLARTGRIDPVIGREEEVRKLTQVLARRSKNNAILVGEPGVGKTAIVEGLAQRIGKGEVPETLKNKRVLALDVATLLSGTKYRGEFEQRAKKIVQEITNSNRTIILFIDEVHSVVQSQGSEGSINFSDILKPALARGDLQMVGATTINEYEKYIKTDLSLERRFQPVEVSEPTEEETIVILQGIKNKYREYHKVEFTDAALRAAVDWSKQLVEGRKLPDKAIDAIDEAAAMVKVSHLHTAVPAVLYQAAVDKHPEVAELWRRVQEIDHQIEKTPSEILTAEREKLESQLAEKGIVTVDSADVEKVIMEWSK